MAERCPSALQPPCRGLDSRAPLCFGFAYSLAQNPFSPTAGGWLAAQSSCTTRNNSGVSRPALRHWLYQLGGSLVVGGRACPCGGAFAGRWSWFWCG
jgi:hypothetical protein